MASVSIVFTRYINYSGSPFEKLMGWSKLACEPEINIVDELNSIAELVVDKKLYTVFGERFNKMLEVEGWRTLVLCGIATESCVLKTAVDAFEQSFCPIVVSDACASNAGNAAHVAGLTVLKQLIGRRQIMTVAELTAELNQTPD